MARLGKTLRNSVLSCVVLVALFLGLGVAYTLLFGQSAPQKAAEPAPKPVATPHEIKPVQPPANAPVGVSVNYLMSPVKAGANTTISVQTRPHATCAISVVYAGTASRDSGLTATKADAYGEADWTWTVGADVPAGSWPVKVTCAYKSKSGVVVDKLQVTR